MDSGKIFVNIFKNFLPNQKTSKQKFENIKKYERIIEKLKNEKTPVYFAFLAVVGHIFEAFLLPCQHEQSLIHILYLEMCDLITKLLTKFVRKKYLCEGSYNQSFKDDSELVSFDVARKEVLKPPG